MESLDTIITDLKGIATSMEYTGPTVDALIYLIANGIYKNNLNAVSAILEASNTRCRLVNSAIQHAKDLGYTVDRGRNQHVVISDITPTQTKTVKAFEQARKIGNLYLYYAHEQTLESGNPTEVEFVVGKKVLEETLEITKDSDLLRLRSRLSNYSNDLVVFDENEKQLNTSTVKHEVLDKNTEANYWMTTTTDYGVELYYFSKGWDGDLTDETAVPLQFPPGAKYTLKGIEYEEEIIEDLKAIASIPGFRFTENTYMKSYEVETRESDITQIYLNSNKSMDSSFMIRATNDIARGVLALGNGIKDCVAKFYLKSTDLPSASDYECDNDNYTSYEAMVAGAPEIVLYYLLDDIDSKLISSDKGTIIDKLKNAYYVAHNIFLTKAQGYEVTEETESIDEETGEPITIITKRKLRYSVVLHYTEHLELNQISDYLIEYKRQIGKDYNPLEINGLLVNQFPGIKYISFIENYDEAVDPEDLRCDKGVYKMKEYQYMDFNIHLEQEAY